MSSTADAPTKLISVPTEQEAAIIVAALAEQGIKASFTGKLPPTSAWECQERFKYM